MPRTGKIISGVIVLFLLLALLLITVIATFDWNRLRPVINHKVSTQLNRAFAIRGDLGVIWQRDRSAPGWQSWVPWPHVHAEDIMLGNPPALPEVTMVHLARVDATLSPLALLQQELYIPWIALKQPDAKLIRTAEGINNWTFNLASGGNNQQPPSAWRFRLDKVIFDRSRIVYRDAINHADVAILVDPLGKPVPYVQVAGGDKDVAKKEASDFVFGWQASGTYHNERLTGNGKIGGMLSLRSALNPFPLEVDVRNGTTRIQLAGSLDDPLNLGGLDLRLQFSGDTLANLYGLTGILLPDTPPYATDGQLIAHLHHRGGPLFIYRDFNGRIGDSDIHGTMTYTHSKPRPKLAGELTSRQLRMADLGPLIGVNSGKGSEKTARAKARRGEISNQPADRVLPHDRFETESWNMMDADVTFSSKRIEHSTSLPLSDLYTHLRLKGGDLLLDPLRFGVAGGTLNSTLSLAGNHSPMRVRADLHARHLRLKQILPNAAAMQKSMGQLNGDATLRGSGNSVAEMLATSNGELNILLDQGVISRNLMELVGLNVGNYVVGKLFGDDEVRINCAVASLQVNNGVAATRLFVFDTENALIAISGTADFAHERLNLSIDPKSKGIRIVTLRSPLYVRGTFKHPDAGVKAGSLIARGAAAIALGTVVAPAAALLALISPSDNEDNPCTHVLRETKSSKKK